jgi:DnaK suppressor protein
VNKPPAKSAADRKTPAAKGAAGVAVKTAEAPKPAPKPAAKAASPAPAPMAPAPAPVSNRFTDRFAPARPNPKPEHVPMEALKPAAKADPKLANAWKTKAGRELSEAELLAMPEAEYMNDKQLDFFRNRLQQQKDDLLSNAGETTEHLREDTTIVPDPADRATIEEEHALELRTRDRERKLLKKIAQSLSRLDSGDYGYCDETGEPIGLARLLARPTATLSLEAQQRRELKQKMFGD